MEKGVRAHDFTQFFLHTFSDSLPCSEWNTSSRYETVNLSRAQHRVELWKDEKDGGRSEWWNYSIAQNHYNLHVEHQNDRWGFGTFFFSSADFGCCWIPWWIFDIENLLFFFSALNTCLSDLHIFFNHFWTSTFPSAPYWILLRGIVKCSMLAFHASMNFSTRLESFLALFFRSNDTHKKNIQQQQHGISKFFHVACPKYVCSFSHTKYAGIMPTRARCLVVTVVQHHRKREFCFIFIFKLVPS